MGPASRCREERLFPAGPLPGPQSGPDPAGPDRHQDQDQQPRLAPGVLHRGPRGTEPWAVCFPRCTHRIWWLRGQLHHPAGGPAPEWNQTLWRLGMCLMCSCVCGRGHHRFACWQDFAISLKFQSNSVFVQKRILSPCAKTRDSSWSNIQWLKQMYHYNVCMVYLIWCIRLTGIGNRYCYLKMSCRKRSITGMGLQYVYAQCPPAACCLLFSCKERNHLFICSSEKETHLQLFLPERVISVTEWQIGSSWEFSALFLGWVGVDWSNLFSLLAQISASQLRVPTDIKRQTDSNGTVSFKFKICTAATSPVPAANRAHYQHHHLLFLSLAAQQFVSSAWAQSVSVPTCWLVVHSGVVLYRTCAVQRCTVSLFLVGMLLPHPSLVYLWHRSCLDLIEIWYVNLSPVCNYPPIPHIPPAFLDPQKTGRGVRLDFLSSITACFPLTPHDVSSLLICFTVSQHPICTGSVTRGSHTSVSG